VVSERRFRRHATLVFAIAFAITACGGDGGGGDEEVLAIDEQLGIDADGILDRQTRAENLIRDCMEAKGFDYVPVDPVAQRDALVGEAGLTEEEFEKEFGYGITTLYEQRRAAASGPNEVIRNQLSESERAEYDQTLFGDDPTATFDVALDTGDFSRLGGCTKEATEKVFGGAEVLQTLQTELDELDDRILADERMVRAVAAWSGCMREKGFDDLADPEEVDAVLEAKLLAIVGSPGTEAEPTFDRAALLALQDEEVQMVAADIACEKKHITDVEDEVRVEEERAFRERNADLLSKVPPP
jgi:hypothetical protein